MKINEKGVTHHIVVLTLAFLVLAVVGFAGYRVYDSRKSASADTGACALSRLTPPNQSGPTVSGDCVKKMKILLNYHISGNPGTPINTANLAYDSDTFSKVKDFQRTKRITVDGIVGPKETWPKLCELPASNPPGFNFDAISANCNASTRGWSYLGKVKYGTTNYSISFYGCRLYGGSNVKFAAYNGAQNNLTGGARIKYMNSEVLFGKGYGESYPALNKGSYAFSDKVLSIPKTDQSRAKMAVSWAYGSAFTNSTSEPMLGPVINTTCP